MKNLVISFLKNIILTGAGGFVGGWILATLILSFIALIGKLEKGGVEGQMGYWHPAIIGLGLIYGATTGCFLALLVRAILFRLSFNDFVVVSLEASGIALVLGCIGGWWGPGPLLAAPVCIGAFAVSALIIGGMKLVMLRG